MSAYLSAIAPLAPDGVHKGRVHSIYRSTVNFTLGNHLFSLQSSGIPRTPVSFSLSPAQTFPAVHPGDPAGWDGNCLFLGSQCYDGSFAVRPSSHPVPLTTGAVSLLLQLQSVCKSTLHAGFAGVVLSHCQPDDLWEQEAFLICGQLRTVSHYSHNFAQTACSMIGLGNGLTPSGDDWLCGVLAVLHALCAQPECISLRNAIRQEIPRHLHKTNDISARFLEVAAAGHFSEPICTLFAAANHAQLPALYRALDAVLALGHSSGADMMSGILFALTHIYRQSSQKLGEYI